ncbi:dehydrogenase/reductase SDR family member 1 [Bacillus haynesii]|uniref:dehydrogenase/reductase SDR family member 1 n=1 Tax=Bacillus haynesii TaxID=1925021 RepID=UPI00228216D7|nr:dehydrogenase/reductase SDR family member 1 [Bacillus haynesii]MCY8571571.1 dehydrogenase/reductase SDR family member 1 [Bacillus haynesii]MCY8592490.1 dehydrogenase/reductase SDR family member 1 [Bacillus haynesii]
MKPLKGKIALVTGGSRGAGRAIAAELGKAGATVYITGRSIRGASTNQWPGTIDDTVSQIEAAGGKGIAVRCDHTNDSETEAVIAKIREEQGKLDILINNVWGAHDLGVEAKPFWELSLKNWDTMFTAGVRAQLATNHFAVPLLRENNQALIIHTTFWDENKYTGQFYYDLAKNAIVRMAYGLSLELKRDNIAVLAVSPGFMRTELVLKHHESDEAHWQESEDLRRTETPYYVGRGITALAKDPDVMEKSGHALRVGDLAKEYQFTDVDGRYIPPFTI